MEHLQSFLERWDQIFKGKDARPIINQIYNVQDEINMDPGRSEEDALLIDFIVNYDEFIKLATERKGHFAGNAFNSLKKFTIYVDEVIKPLFPKNEIYIAPFWFSRTKNDLLNDHPPYSDTLYIKVDSTFQNKYNLEKMNQTIGADECDVITNYRPSNSGEQYVRLWWD
jgi:hypothetical protein